MSKKVSTVELIQRKASFNRAIIKEFDDAIKEFLIKNDPENSIKRGFLWDCYISRYGIDDVHDNATVLSKELNNSISLETAIALVKAVETKIKREAWAIEWHTDTLSMRL